MKSRSKQESTLTSQILNLKHNLPVNTTVLFVCWPMIALQQPTQFAIQPTSLHNHS